MQKGRLEGRGRATLAVLGDDRSARDSLSLWVPLARSAKLIRRDGSMLGGACITKRLNSWVQAGFTFTPHPCP